MSERRDFDPHAVPVQPAATVMIVSDRPDLRVLMIERSARLVFGGGMWVFPGGRVDPGEAEALEPCCDGLDDAEASRILGVESGGLAFWVAAIRENLEEAGLLLGRRRDGGPVDPGDLAGARRSLETGVTTLAEVVRGLDLVLDTSAVHYVAHWITPPGSPRRFSARFFVSAMPDDQAIAHDETETVDWAWLAPHEALARHRDGAIEMMSPTLRMLENLAAFESADAVLAAARAGCPEERVRVRFEPAGGYRVVIPGEPGYDTGDEHVETGWIRLRARL